MKALDMIAVRVRDWPAMVRWYEEILGLTLYHREDDDLFAVLGVGDGATLALVGEHPVVLGTENRVIPGFQVEDLDATLKQLEGKGVLPEDTEGGHDGAYRLARIRDPEGNLLQLYWTRPE